MTRHFVLVDYENVQPKGLGALVAGDAEVRVFAGTSQHKVDLSLAQAMQPFGARAAYVQVNGSGRNALDFHVAFHLGELVAANPGAQFTIVSKDTGFDPLVRHLNARGIECRRTPTLGVHAVARAAPAAAATASAPGKSAPPKAPPVPRQSSAKAAAAKPAATTAVGSAALADIGDWLKRLKAARPRTRKTLESSIKARVKPAPAAAAVALLLTALQQAGMIQIADSGKVTYDL